MRATLLIHFHDVTLLDWTVFDAQSQVVNHATATTLDSLPPLTNQQVIVLLPNTELLLTTLEIPAMPAHRLQQAVPYALEEQVAEDIEDLHFALGGRDAEKRLAVAVVARRDFDKYLKQLREHHLTATVILPEVFAVPLTEGWSVLQLGQRVVVRSGKQAGFAVETENLATVLALSELPIQITLWGKMTESVRLALMALNIPIIEQQLSENTLVTTSYQSHFFNLLQGTYQPTRATMQWWRPWRLTVVLLVFFGVLQLADLVIFYQQLQQQTQQLNQQIEQIYRQTFPTAQKIVNPRVQMEQQLKELTAKTTHSPSANFLVMLNQLSPILTKATALTVKEIHFQNNKLELNLEATDVTTLEGLKRLLKAANVDATVITLSNDIKAVKAKLQMGGISTN